MNTLIINSSPHKDGSTSYLSELLAEGLKGEVTKINIRDIDFSPCIDCGKCRTQTHCVLNDGISAVIESLDNYDCIVLASPLYYNQPTGGMLNFLSRLQLWFLSERLTPRAKKAVIILTGGGDCVVNSADAEKTLRIALRSINAGVASYVRSLSTSSVPAKEDASANEQVKAALSALE